MRRLIALILLICFTFTVTTEGKAFAASPGGPSAGGSAAGPAGKILESFHSDLATGRAVFGIPLAVPPGRRGVQPAIGLSYSSSGRNGPIGVGWSLELGSIERSTRFGLPKFDSSDTFTVQAGGTTSDLVQVGPGKYQPQDEQAFARIQFDGTRWTVTSKDGATATFGGTPDAVKSTSLGVVAWLLNEVKDIHGNTMTLTYQVDGRHPYPASILYTAHPATGLAPTREVRFTWEPRPDMEWNERFGDRIETRLRLQKVEAFHQNALVRRYTLTYAASPMTGRSMLTRVTTLGADGVTSLPPIVLSYSNSWGGWMRSTQWKTLTNGPVLLDFVNANGKDMGLRLEDVNGDGRLDVLKWLAGDTDPRRAFINSANGWIDASLYTAQWRPPMPFVVVNGDGNNEDTGGRFADLNGDGRADLVYSHQTRHGAIYLNTGSGWLETPSELSWSRMPVCPPRLRGNPCVWPSDQKSL